jgi:hypothetical protein
LLAGAYQLYDHISLMVIKLSGTAKDFAIFLCFSKACIDALAYHFSLKLSEDKKDKGLFSSSPFAQSYH